MAVCKAKLDNSVSRGGPSRSSGRGFRRSMKLLLEVDVVEVGEGCTGTCFLCVLRKPVCLLRCYLCAVAILFLAFTGERMGSKEWM
jgi:hypothetical protein